MAQEPLRVAEDLAHVFAAMERGTRRQRLRVAEVVCPAGHRLVDVYRGASEELWGICVENTPGSGRAKGTKRWVAYRMQDDLRGRDEGALAKSFPLWCRCANGYGWENLPATAILGAIDAGARKIVAPDEWNEALLDVDGTSARAREVRFWHPVDRQVLGIPTQQFA